MKKLHLNRETIRNLDPSDLGNVHGGTGNADDSICSCPPRLCIKTQCNEDTCHCNTVRYCINTYDPVC